MRQRTFGQALLFILAIVAICQLTMRPPVYRSLDSTVTVENLVATGNVSVGGTLTGGGGTFFKTAGDHLSSSGSTVSLAQIATQSFLGRTTASTGNVETLTATQATAMLNVATTSAKGLVPVLPNDATKFLDGTGNFTVPGSGAITLTSTNAASGSTNLSTLGTIDWLFPPATTSQPIAQSGFSVRYKRTGGWIYNTFKWFPNSLATNITNTSPNTTTTTAADDSTGSALSTTTINGVNSASVYSGFGFSVRVPTSTSTRVLRVYTMIFNADMTVDCLLASGSATTTSSRTGVGANNDNRVWTITVQTPIPTDLLCNWNVTGRSSTGNANINLFVEGVSYGPS